MPGTTIDLRSDTVTKPSDAMWDAMRSAPLGDDVLGDEPTVQKLEARIAALLGKEAAVFVPSGTMANQLAIKSATDPADEVIAHRDSHIIHYEGGGPAAISGCMIQPLSGEGGMFDDAAVAAAIRSTDVHYPRSRMLVVENTHNRGGGSVWPLDSFRAVARMAHQHALHVHVDGARLFNAAVAAGYSAREFVADADSVSVCFSKGLGCPVGSALCGSNHLIARARRVRKYLGGGMRQSGLLAAAALYALDHNIARLADDHALARQFARGLTSIQGLNLQVSAEQTPSNMVFFFVDSALGGAPQFAQRLIDAGVRVIALDPNRIRAVTHLDVSAADIAKAIEVARSIGRSPA
ncbi:MAG: aminotransferase class I/II-fold pyridoxal phosphate-dependent enzyme [Phycisphaerales bacterium]|nr:aminotransferase class I/II-fold pyridoxal phosphate-dependent enzyme [Phycisphaerales bacterium]